MYDIAIIGAGPAGATLARLLGKNYRVLLMDKRILEAPAEKDSVVKCCGGLVAPDAQKILAELGLGLPKEVLVGPQLFVVRTIDLQNNLETYYQRFYINIDREKFDRWIVSLVPGNVAVRFGCIYKAFEKEDAGYKIIYTKDGKEYTDSAKIIIGADGAFSMIRKQAFSHRPSPDKYISIQEWFQAEELQPYFSAIFDPEISDFYSWTIPKAGYLLVGAALPPQKEPNMKFDLLKRKLAHYGFKLGKCVKREGAFILRPRSQRQLCLGEDRIALVGEAAGWISPSSAEGLSYGFSSALALAESLKDGTENFLSRYSSNTLGLRWNIIEKNIKSPFMYNSLLRKTVMMSGIQGLQIHKY